MGALPLEALDDAAVLAELEALANQESVADEVLAEAEQLRGSFALFAQAAWPVIEPGVPLQWGRLQDAMAYHLQAVTEGHILDLLLNVRPRSSKSRLASVLWPAWEWTRNPAKRFLTGSFELGLSRTLSRLSLDLIRSRWYRQRFPGVVIRRDLNAPSHFGNTAGGAREITANRAGVTGKGGERLLWDDPHDAKKRGSKADLEAARIFWRAFSSRRNNAKSDSRVVLGQRVGHNDIFSTLLAEEGWVVLKLRTRFKPTDRCRTPIRWVDEDGQAREGWEDPRTEEGEYLDPERHGPAEDAKARVELGPQDYAAQHDQDPTPEGGQIFKLEDFRRWRYVDEGRATGVLLPDKDTLGRVIHLVPRPGPGGQAWAQHFDDLVQSWDFAFKGEDTSDYVVGQVWGRKGPNFYLLHQVRARMEFDACLVAMKQLAALYPAVVTKLVEAKANGIAIVNMLKSSLLGLEEVDPGSNGKPARARAVAPLVRAGNVYLPEETVRWGEESSVAEYQQELAEFPKGSHDDQVDATSQALDALYQKYQTWLEGMALATGQPTPGGAQDVGSLLLAALSGKR